MAKRIKRNPRYNKGKKRASTKGKSKYDIYLEWRERLKAQGYILSDGLSVDEFNKVYKVGHEEKAKNITRSIARNDIQVTKTGKKRIEQDLLTGANLTLAQFYDVTTGELNLKGMTKKELYDYYKQKAIDDHGWKRNPSKPEKWEEAFFKGGGLY